LGDITVGDGAVIGANAVVVRDVEPGAVMGGVPAKVIRRREG
jgi:serine O-acetyltransferase